MTARRRNIPCSAERPVAHRLGLPILLVAVLGLAACGEAASPPEKAAAQMAPYSAIAVVPPPPEVDPDELLGLSADDVTAKLGRPTLVRRERDAEIWQYRQTDCVLDLFLYGNAKQVEHVDLRDRGDATEAAVRACFQRMLQKKEQKKGPDST